MSRKKLRKSNTSNMQRKKKDHKLSKQSPSFSNKINEFLKRIKPSLIRLISMILAISVIIILFPIRHSEMLNENGFVSLAFAIGVFGLYLQVQRHIEDTLKIFFG